MGALVNSQGNDRELEPHPAVKSYGYLGIFHGTLDNVDQRELPQIEKRGSLAA